MTVQAVAFFPIRHHSPACALALLRGFEELRPAQVLIEAPVDLAPLVPLLLDPATRPPVAIVSLPPAVPDEGDRLTAIYPLCGHSPELAALSWAARNGAAARLIDLPARHPRRARRASGQQHEPVPLIADWRIDHNAYVSRLCARRGVADGLQLWDALFESRAGTADWRGFFRAVGAYCRHTREVADPLEMEADGTLARETHMAQSLTDALATGPRPIAVVTGGFHTPALEASLTSATVGAATADEEPAPSPNAFLIRYGFRQLDRARGYAAGLPHPAWYDRLWHSARAGGGPSGQLALEILVDFADHLRRTRPHLVLATPTLRAAWLAAQRLAELRELPAPGRSELVDAVRSAAAKQALELGTDPLLDAFHEFLGGDAMGELPPGTAQPPIVEAVRRQAAHLRFSLKDGARRSRELDVLRRPRHAEASRFLHALELAGAGFATRLRGPDPLTGWRADALFETWVYAWSPMVEAELIARVADGQTLEALCLAELERRRTLLEADGRGRSAAAAGPLLVAAVRTGFQSAIERAASWCAEALAEDPEPASIIEALSVTAALARPGLGAPDRARHFAWLRRKLFQRLIMLFPDLAQAPEDRLPAQIKALAVLAGLIAGEDEAVDRPALGQVLQNVQAASPPPALAGALLAFAAVIGFITDEEAACRIERLLSGSYLEPGAAAAVLTGCLAVSAKLILHSEALLAAADDFLSKAEHGAFVSALPELRLAFSQLTPDEVDRVAAWAAKRHGLQARQLAEGTAPAREVEENLALSEKISAVWREDRLTHWLEAEP